MSQLKAEDALSPMFEVAPPDARPVIRLAGPRRTGPFAVFREPAGVEAPPEFLGVVGITEVARFPHRIFADLIPLVRRDPIPAGALLVDVLKQMDQTCVDELPVVDANGVFLGVVERTAVLRALLADAEVIRATPPPQKPGTVTDEPPGPRVVEARRKPSVVPRSVQYSPAEAVGHVVGGFAHNFNNLLTVIRGYTELSLRLLEESHPCHEGLEEIRKACEKAGRLTQSLLAASGRQMLAPRAVALDAFLTRLEPALRDVLGPGIEFHARVESGLSDVWFDEARLAEILTELASNSRDAMLPGGEFRVEARTVFLDPVIVPALAHLPPGHYVHLAVRDTGSGMDDATRRRAAEPFFTTKSPNSATGMGLAVVAGIVRQGNGDLEVQSEPSRGTTVHLYLPRPKPADVKPG